MAMPTTLTELSAFSGGMNNVTAPYLIRRDESVVLTNVNLRRGSMESVPRLTRVQNIGTPYFYEFNGSLITYGAWRSNVIWDNKLYWSDGSQLGKILFDGTELPLGIPTPVEKLDGEVVPETSPTSNEDHYSGNITGGSSITMEDLTGGNWKITDSGSGTIDNRKIVFHMDYEYQLDHAYVVFYADIESGSRRFEKYWNGTEIKDLPNGVHVVRNGRNSVMVEDLTIKLATITLYPEANGSASVMEFYDNSVMVYEEGGVHFGNMKYTYTFYDSEHGTESAPAPLSLYIDAEGQDIRLTGFSPLPTEANKYRIYRIGGYLPYFQLVDEYDPIPDPANPPLVEEYFFLDDLDDTEIDGTELTTLQTDVPPGDTHFIVEMNGRLFGALGNQLIYSAIGNPDAWYVLDFIPMRDTITGLAPVPGGLLVMGDYWTSILKGTGPTNFIMRVLSDKIGCREASSINYIDTTAIWLSYHGVVMSDGFAIRQLTADRIENIAGLNPRGSVVINNMYYLSYKPSLVPSPLLLPDTKLYPDGVVGTGGIEQGMIVLDFKRGNGYAYKIHDIPDIQYISPYKGLLGVVHGRSEDPLAPDCGDTVFSDCWDFFQCSGMELAVYSGLGLDQLGLEHLEEMEYMSPLMVDNSTVMLKEYDKVRVIYRGIFKLDIMFDNDRVIQTDEFSSPNEFDFDEVLIGIPNEDNKAYSIRFLIKGRGTIKGIQYSYKMREQA